MDPERVREEGLTTDDLMDHMIGPEDVPTEAYPMWEEYPRDWEDLTATSNADIRNERIETHEEYGPMLCFDTDDGFTIKLWCRDFGDWEARYEPDEPLPFMEHDFKSRYPVVIPTRKYGDIDLRFDHVLGRPAGYVDRFDRDSTDEPGIDGIHIRLTDVEAMPISDVLKYFNTILNARDESNEAIEQHEETFSEAARNSKGN